MPELSEPASVPSRETLIHLLYEAAELEHTLMCTYLYAAFSLRSGTSDGLSPEEASVVDGWRQRILSVAIDEMGHLSAVWNITAALGGAPRFGRDNFPLDAGNLPARLVVKLAPFNRDVLQHFIHLERPHGSDEADGEDFAPPSLFIRAVTAKRITPMPVDYETVGDFYEHLADSLRSFVAAHGEEQAFVGDPALQLSPAEIEIAGARPVICSKTALAAFRAIVEQGEGAPADAEASHYQRFLSIRREFDELLAKNPAFSPAFPAAHNPVLRPPMGRSGRVWLEDPETAAVVDVANTSYALMLRLLAHSYVVPRPDPTKQLVIDLALGLMHAMGPLGELAARLPAGPSNPDCHGGMSFTSLRDASPIPPGPSAARFFCERLEELGQAAMALRPSPDGRVARAVKVLAEQSARAAREFPRALAAGSSPKITLPVVPAAAGAAAPIPTRVDGVDAIEGRDLTLLYEGKRCIHARFCVTGAPGVFVANVEGPWIHPDAVEVNGLVEIAHACPSGAIRYRRKDGHLDEGPPPVNLISIRESGPYAVRAQLNLGGKQELRATLCRCGASKNKPYCDGSHHDAPFVASGEPVTSAPDMLADRAGELSIEPLTDGPLAVRGNVEITSGTGRVVARLTQAKLCRCGGSQNKPFCDGSHARIGFRSS